MFGMLLLCEQIMLFSLNHLLNTINFFNLSFIKKKFSNALPIIIKGPSINTF